MARYLQKWGRKYPYAGYGGNFCRWLTSSNPQPYNSWGNGSGMRVSPCGLAADSLNDALSLAKISAECTHNHPEGIKGAQAIAACMYMARTGKSKAEIRDYVTTTFGYNLNRKLDDIRPTYRFDVSCPGSVPEAILAFLEGNDFEEVIRLAISLGGDSDTIGAMAGAIASCMYEIPPLMIDECRNRLPEDMLEVIDSFEAKYCFGPHNPTTSRPNNLTTCEVELAKLK